MSVWAHSRSSQGWTFLVSDDFTDTVTVISQLHHHSDSKSIEYSLLHIWDTPLCFEVYILFNRNVLSIACCEKFTTNGLQFNKMRSILHVQCSNVFVLDLDDMVTWHGSQKEKYRIFHNLKLIEVQFGSVAEKTDLTCKSVYLEKVKMYWD